MVETTQQWWRSNLFPLLVFGVTNAVIWQLGGRVSGASIMYGLSGLLAVNLSYWLADRYRWPSGGRLGMMALLTTAFILATALGWYFLSGQGL